MKEYFKDRWPLIVILLAFIIVKIPHLSYPFLWDESWPYAPAIYQLYHHGISLMPGAVEPNLSRGHPLLFHALTVIWMNIFGTSHFAMHSFALCISLLVLVYVYEAGLAFFNKKVAFLAAFIIATQVVFYIQSSFLLLEVMLALFCFLSLYFYVKEKYFLTALFMTAAFYTKESGLIVGFIIGIDVLLRFFDKKIPLKKKLIAILSVAIPVLLIAIFFLLQKKINGWYIFPMYNDSIVSDMNMVFYKFRVTSMRIAVYEDYRYCYFLLLGLAGIVAAIKTKNFRYTLLLIPIIFVWVMLDDKRANVFLPWVLFTSLLISITGCFFFFSKLLPSPQRRFVSICFLFFLAITVYSSFNFFTYRYILSALIPLLFILAAFLYNFTERISVKLYYPLYAVLLLFSFFSYEYDQGIGDCSRSAYRIMDVEKEITGYFEKNNLYDKHIASHAYLNQEHLIDTSTGFLKSGKTFPYVTWGSDSSTDYVITDNIENQDIGNDIVNDTTFEVVYDIRNWEVWAKIYKKKKIK